MNQRYHTVIIGGGLSGLTVAHKLRLNNPNHTLLVIDKASRPGGVIQTHREYGFIAEIGPHGFLDNCEESKQILRETGLDAEAVKAPLIDFVRYVYLNGQLNLIPQTPLKILKAPLIPWTSKLRVLAELWQPVLTGEPTVAKWINHRFGPALLPFLDAVYTGTYAGDFDRLTIDSVMPGARALEQEYGSVLRGLLSKARKKGKTGDRKEKFTMPAMTSFSTGMQRLPEKLAEPFKNGRDLQLDTAVTAIARVKEGWQIATSAGVVIARNLVCALPVNAALKILNPLDPAIPLQRIPESWISTVVFGFRDSVKLPPGFGFLTPETEQRFALGTLFSSNMFPGRAPHGHIVFETLVGGRRHPERLELDAKSLTDNALRDVSDILNIREEPVYSTILRSDGGIPQLEQAYPQLLRWRQSFQASHPRLHICGFGWGGIGLNDMMKSATEVASRILSPASDTALEPELKGVYF